MVALWSVYWVPVLVPFYQSCTRNSYRDQVRGPNQSLLPPLLYVGGPTATNLNCFDLLVHVKTVS